MFYKALNVRFSANLLRLATVLLLILSSLFILSPTYRITTSQYHESQFPTGHIHNLIRRQALSHGAFHSRPFNDALVDLSLLGRKQLEGLGELKGDDVKIAVVGVEHGLEVRWFAKNRGYHVYAFEALEKFRDRMADWIQKDKSLRKGQVELFDVAASTSAGEINVTYQGHSATVKSGRVDEYVKDYVDVMSMDVQGAERFVLEGTTALVKEEKVGMFWIELIAQKDFRENELWILEYLDRNNFLIFDFVPWGKSKRFKPGQYNFPKENALESYFLDPVPSRGFNEYLDVMNTAAQNFVFLQTDLVAIRRDLATPDVLQGVHDLARIACGNLDWTSPCNYRTLRQKTGGAPA